MMNQVKNICSRSTRIFFLLAFSFLILGLIGSCGSKELRVLKEEQKETFDQELSRLKKQSEEYIISTGQIKAKSLGLSTVYMKVMFQKESTHPKDDPKFIKYQPWWNTKEGVWGFTGVAQKVYENISDVLELKDGSVKNISQNMFSGLDPTKSIFYPVKVPTGGIEQFENMKKYIDLAVVTSYNYGAFNANQGRSIAQVAVDKESAMFFPYFNIFLNKDLATVGKMNGEMVITYKAFINGYFQICNHKGCEQATLPKGQHLTLNVPLPPLEALGNKKKQEALNIFAQKHLGQALTDLALIALNDLRK